MTMSKSEAGKLGQALSIQTQRKNRELKEQAYLANPTKCQQCAESIEYKKRANKFCSSSCAATYNNILVPKRQKIVHSELVLVPNRPQIKTGLSCPSNCLHCNSTFWHTPKSKQKFCSVICSLDHKKHIRHSNIESDNIVDHKMMKNYLVEKHGNTCLDPNCAWDFTKRPIKVELEHIDGNSSNTKLSNCTLLCPNCHSQTPTYKGKNKGNGRHFRRQRYAEGKSY